MLVEMSSKTREELCAEVSCEDVWRVDVMNVCKAV